VTDDDACADIDAFPDIALGTDPGALADDSEVPDACGRTDDRIRRDHGGLRDHRARERGHARAASGAGRYETRAPPDRRLRMPASSTRTTRRPASPSLRGFLPPWMHSMKWRISSCSASVIGTRGLRMSPARYERRSSSLESSSTPKS